jgi:GLPGLI family protein
MNFLIKLLLFTSFTTIAQHKIVEIDYIVKKTIHKNIAFEFDSKLSYNDSCSVFLLDLNSERTIDENQQLNQFNAILPMQKLDNYKDYTIYKKNDVFVQFTRQIGKKAFLVQDTTPKLNWNITSEEKTIAGLNCSKATMEFRGRKYVAWFTTSLPINYGPWKFNGLPGVILEVYDTELLYVWQAKKIITKDKELKIPKLNYKIVSMQESEKIDYDYFYEKIAIQQSKTPDKKITVTEGRLMELKFEWEEKQSK